jgi:hypothetical protein
MPDPSPAAIERRCAARVETCFPVALSRAGCDATAGEVANLSATGMLVRVDDELAIWSVMTAVLPGAGQREVRVVRRNGDAYGCLFQAPLEGDEVEAVLGSGEALAGLERLRAAPEPSGSRRPRLWRRGSPTKASPATL